MSNDSDRRYIEGSSAPSEACGSTTCRTAGLLIVSDIRFLREGLAEVLAQDDTFPIVGAAGSVEEALETVAQRGEPEIILIDASLPEARTLAVILQARATSARLVAFAVAETEDEVIAWAEAGVFGYLPRTTPLRDIVSRLREIRRGEQSSAGHVVTGLLGAIRIDHLLNA